MRKLLIEGGKPLIGSVKVSGAKNAVLKLMAASLLGEGTFYIDNVPRIKDVYTMIGLLEALGVEVFFDQTYLKLDVAKINETAPEKYVREMRASIQILGPVLAKNKKVKLSMPGGCKLGPRPIDLHLTNLRKLGAQIREENGFIFAETDQLRGAELYLDFPSVGATENLMMAATLAEGTTTIRNAAKEPEIVDVQNFLNKMGACIWGAGTSTIVIKGVNKLSNTSYSVIPDRIEAGSYLVAAALAGGELTVYNVIPEHISSLLTKLEDANAKLIVEPDAVTVTAQRPLYPVNLITQPYPGFATDLQPQFMSLAVVAEGTSVFKETIYSNRFSHVEEFHKMGANIIVDGNVAVIKGVKKLKGAKVVALDLRAGAALVIAGLAASGITEVTGIQHIDRGYENLIEKFQSIGAQIRRES